MVKTYKKSLFVFRRDFRIVDNLGLAECLKQSEKVVCCFIFSDLQISSKNSFKSNNAIQFMVESLADLNSRVGSKLTFFHTPSWDNILISHIVANHQIEAVFENTDYTPFAQKRSSKIRKSLSAIGVDYLTFEDYRLIPIVDIPTTSTGDYYKKFTPYLRKALNRKIQKPSKKIPHESRFTAMASKTSKKCECCKLRISEKESHKFYSENPDIHARGGRAEALSKLNSVKSSLKQYNFTRNILVAGTSNLSAYIKFGCVSIREVANVFGKLPDSASDLMNQLHWRDFYYHVAWFKPSVLQIPATPGRNFSDSKWKKPAWNNSKKNLFNKWKSATTGEDLIDACMNQLNTTGFMHNRGRLIVADYLIKKLKIDWAKGEKYFATKLIDYDPIVNNGNWQFISGTGASAQPQFREFNIARQLEKFDKDGKYMEKWKK